MYVSVYIHTIIHVHYTDLEKTNIFPRNNCKSYILTSVCDDGEIPHFSDKRPPINRILIVIITYLGEAFSN